MNKKIKEFFERDQDITYYDEWNYIYITLKETIKIIMCNYVERVKSFVLSVSI